MRISEKGIALIKEFEGLKLKAYPDPGSGGYPWTIGYGTTVYPLGNGVSPGDVITECEAEDYLKSDIEETERFVLGVVEVPLKQCEFDALVSFMYNVGIDNFRDSTLLKLLNNGDYEGAASQFSRWVYAKGKKMNGLINRREAEKQLFLGNM